MKNFNKLLFAILTLIMLVGCEDTNQVDPEEIQEELTHIESLEIETGIQFYKQDITITDDSGENFIVMKVAAKSEAMVNAYLENYELKISPIYENDLNSPLLNNPIEQPLTDNPPVLDDSEEAYLDGVFTELIKVQLAFNVVGLRTIYKPKKPLVEKGRIMAPEDFPKHATHYNNSGNWPEEFRINAYSPTGYDFDGKSRWYSGWSSRTFCDSFNSSDCRSYWEHSGTKYINIDGPYDVRVTVHYVHYSYYQFEWINV